MSCLLGRCAQATLSKKALLHNLSVIRGQAPHAKVVAMIKANGYGHGIRQVALRLDGHCDYFGVVSIEEALVVSGLEVKTPILLIEGPTTREELDECLRRRFAFVLHREEQLVWLEESRSLDAEVWVMLDTGMGHLGFSFEEHVRVLGRLQRARCAKNIVLMSHFACAEALEHESNLLQIRRFQSVVDAWKLPASFCNTAGVFHFPKQHYDIIRPGIGLYGAVRSLDHRLVPVMTLRSHVIAVRVLKEGQSIGYGGIYQCMRETRVAVVAMGYGDGYPLNHFDGLPVSIHGNRCCTLGKVAMDRLVVDISLMSHGSVKVGDDVEFWGENLDLEEVARKSQRSVYELLCGIQNRVKFTWDDAVE